MKNRFALITIVLVFVSILLAGCGLKSEIIGSWEGPLHTLTFNNDGTVNTTVFGIVTESYYEFIDKDTVRITDPRLGTSIDYDVKISDDTLYLESDGIGLAYTKAK